ncbi:MAG: hypothetical protein KA715_09690 [Xanthomonadaceae bacterium]|nr:hypothetical protein [Xanthomonadaceae bacterium]
MNKKEINWYQILRFSCLLVLVTGLLPSLAVFQITQEPWRFFFDLLIWPIDQNPATFTQSDRQLSAVLGGVLSGWAWLLYQLARPEVFNQRIKKFMIQSVWLWFLLDSVGSVFSGIPLNAVSNIGFLLMLLIPIYQLKR